MSGFKSVPGGFQMTFNNGLTISVMFRSGNYCEHKYADWEVAANNLRDNGFHGSPDAEIAIWDANDKWLNFDYDQVKGYVPSDEVAGWIHRAATARDIAELQASVEVAA